MGRAFSDDAFWKDVQTNGETEGWFIRLTFIYTDRIPKQNPIRTLISFVPIDIITSSILRRYSKTMRVIRHKHKQWQILVFRNSRYFLKWHYIWKGGINIMNIRLDLIYSFVICGFSIWCDHASPWQLVRTVYCYVCCCQLRTEIGIVLQCTAPNGVIH